MGTGEEGGVRGPSPSASLGRLSFFFKGEDSSFLEGFSFPQTPFQ